MLGNGILQWSIAGNFPHFHIICCFMNRFQTFETNKILFPVPLSKKLKVNVWLFEKFDSFFCVYINLQQPDSEWLVGNLISVALGQLWEFGNRFCSIKWFTVAPFSHERLWICCCQRVTVCTCQSNPCCQWTSCTSRSTQQAGSSSLHHPADITTSKLLCCSTFRGVCAQGSGALTTKKDLPRNRNADTHIALHANFFVYSEKHRFKLLVYTLLCMNEDWRGSQTELRVKMIVWRSWLMDVSMIGRLIFLHHLQLYLCEMSFCSKWTVSGHHVVHYSWTFMHSKGYTVCVSVACVDAVKPQ